MDAQQVLSTGQNGLMMLLMISAPVLLTVLVVGLVVSIFQAATQTPGEPLGVMAFGKNLLRDKPEVGQAFMRAYIRTINTYFNGNYHQDDKVMAEIQKWTSATDAAQAELAKQLPLTFDWEVRKDTTTRIQTLFLDLGVITDFKTPVAEDKLVDRSVYEKVLGVK